MRLLIFITLLSFIYCVASKNNVKSLTESMGQEVIEIGAPVKEPPAGSEEEPAAENYYEDKLSSNTILPATKKIKKTTPSPETRRKSKKDIDKLDGVGQDDEEARIEKELSEIYKDTPDYKADSAEPAKEKVTLRTTVEEVDKPIARQPGYLTTENVHGDLNRAKNVGQKRTTNFYGDLDSDEYVVRGEAPFIPSTQTPKPPAEVPSKKNSASNFIIRSTYLCLTTFIAHY